MGSRLKVPEVYPPKGWNCPGCGKKHKAPHYAHPDQLDYNLKPAEKGRVKFNRRQKNDRLDTNQTIRHDLPHTGSQFDDNGYQNPIMCPHCGWEDNWMIIEKDGPMMSLIEQFLEKVNGDVDSMSGRDGIQQFMGFLKGKGVVE